MSMSNNTTTTTSNGVESFIDLSTYEIITKDGDLEPFKVSDLKRELGDVEVGEFDLLLSGNEEEENTEKIKIMALEIDELKKTKVRLQVELDRSKKIEDLEKEKRSMMEEMEGLKQKTRNSVSELDRSREDNKTLEKENSFLEREILLVTKKLEEIEERNMKIEDVEWKIRDLEHVKICRMEILEELRQDMRNLVSDVERLEYDEKGDLKTLIYSYESRMDRFSEEMIYIVKELKQKNFEMEEKMKSCAAEKAKMENRISELQKEIGFIGKPVMPGYSMDTD